MINNYFKFAFRSLKNNKIYSIINILGLTLGITCAILIFTFVRYHLSFDKFHTKSDRIYRITTEFHSESIDYSPGVPYPLGEAFRNDYTIADKVARVTSLSGRVVTFTNNDKKFEEDIAFAEPSFFEIMDFPLVRGNKYDILSEPNTALVTQRIAKKYFGDKDPVGQILRIDNTLDVTISGILKDLPFNTDRKEEIYLPFYNLKNISPWMVEEDWWLSYNKAMQCFILLKPGIQKVTVEKALSDLSEKYYDKKNAQIFRFKLQPLSDIHFNPNLGGYVAKKMLWTLSLIGVFLIIMASVNFINLAVSQALERSKIIGIKKVIGSIRSQIFWQFIAETSVISVMAIVLAIVIAYFSLPYVNLLLNTHLRVNLFHNSYLAAFLSLLLLVIIFLSGSYPGIVMAGMKPLAVMKGNVQSRNIGSVPIRKGLVVSQFIISQLLIICTLVVVNQMRYIKQADLGFQKDGIVMLPVPDNSNSKIATLSSQLSQIAGVEKVTFCNYAPASKINPSTGIQYDSRPEPEKFSIILKEGDNNYLSVFGLEVLEGRNFYPSDTIREFLINETAVKKLGAVQLKDVIGRNAIINGRKGRIVGVIKDFHNKSFHEAIDAVCITTERNNYNNCAVEISSTSQISALAALKNAWNDVYPNSVYNFDFLDSRIARFYELDNMVLRSIRVFAIIAILIGCLGLYGLISFISTQKTKEIGIRKVNGAKISEILAMLNKDFVKWVIIAFVVATPIAYYSMNRWLENFAYKTTLSWWIFALAGLLALGIALLTVSWQSWRAATRNPVEALRYE